MFEIAKASIAPENFMAGDFPMITDVGKVKSGATVRKYAPVIRGADGIEEAATATLADIAGIAAVGGEDGGDIVYYLTGEFFASAIALPKDVTVDLLKPVCRKLSIFLREGK